MAGFSVYRAAHQLVALLALAGWVAGKQVLHLNNDDFDHAAKEHRLLLVAYGAPWCRFSQMLQPIWDQLAMALDGPQYEGVGIASVDCEAQKPLAQRFSISKYPTIKVLRNGEVLPKEYRGARSVPHFKDYVDKLLSPPVTEITSSADFAQLGSHGKVVLGVFKDKENEFKAFEAVADKLRDFCHFHYTISGGDEQARTEHPELSGQLPIIKFKKRNMDTQFTNPSGFTQDALLAWATEQCRPLVDEITFDNGEELTEEGLPFFIAFTLPEDEYSRQRFADAVRGHVQHERHRIKFLVADGLKFAHPLAHMNKTKHDLPVIAIDDFKHMYEFGGLSKLTEPNAMQQFIDDLFSGKLHHDFHNKHESHPPPESEMKHLAPSQNRYSRPRDEL
eukprot:comp23063_c0_seq1/m.36950 comp23063_c0_seq1/g.36950  ORF comp23063_c0_seq1/g.36950 comp23063_c0_seq1/m.36950 type:complete len:391 (-) comp23063_c0_seq1:188-1360(-)